MEIELRLPFLCSTFSHRQNWQIEEWLQMKKNASIHGGVKERAFLFKGSKDTSGHVCFRPKRAELGSLTSERVDCLCITSP